MSSGSPDAHGALPRRRRPPLRRARPAGRRGPTAARRPRRGPRRGRRPPQDPGREAVTADRLRLEDVRFYGHHGVSTAEQTVGVWFSVDAELTLDLTSAAVSDDLACAVDYGQVARRH